MNLEKDTQPFINKLPLIAADLPVFFVRKLTDSKNSNVYKDFKVSTQNMWKWLKFLIQHNKLCPDLIDDENNLNTLPENGSTCNDLQLFNIEDED